MSLHYLLDGYNIIHQIPSLVAKKLEGGREGLIRFIDNYRPQGSRKNSVTVVFDGQAGVISPQVQRSIKVVFSQDESADDKIRSIVAKSLQKKNIVVVSDDKELRFSVRALGAKVLNVKDFLMQTRSVLVLTPKGNVKKEEEKNIPKTLEHKITDELKKIWLK